MKKILKPLVAAVLAASPLLARAGVLTVQSPNNNEFVGATTDIKVQTSQGFTKVTVTANIVKQGGGASTTLTTDIFPDGDGKGNGTMTWNAGGSFPEGLYDITVTATSDDTFWNTEVRTVTLDTTKPKFTTFSPTDGSFFNGTIDITATLTESNGIKQWRVTVDGNDIPNNTGTSLNIDVPFTPANDEDDGPRKIKIEAKDLAGNTASVEFTINLDRQPPKIVVTYPRSDFRVRPNSNLAVTIEITDATNTAVDVSAVVVELRDMDDNLIRRVARRSYQPISDTAVRWAGRVRMDVGNRTRVKIVVRATDRAGNAGVTQEIELQVGRR